MRIDAIDLALKMRDQQAQMSRRADETMEYASAAAIAGFFSDKAKYFSPAIDIADVLRKIDSCICEPCGDDTPPENPIEGEKDKQSYDPLAFDMNNDGTITTINVDDSKVYVDVDNDKLGGKSNDQLCGGGNDTYVFNRGDGKDTIGDSAGDSDRILFKDINASEIGLFKSGSTLQLSYGADDTISISSGNIERFEFADGGYLTDNDVNYIIQQMSAFSRDNGVYFTNANDVRMNEQFNQIVTNQMRREFDFA